MNKVGYGNPPVETRFRKGESGNPRGRPRKQRLDLEDIIRDSLNKKETYFENGISHTATRWEILVKKLTREFISGNFAAGATLLKIQKMSGGEELPAKVIYVQNMLPFDMPTGKNDQVRSRRSAKATFAARHDTKFLGSRTGD